MNILLLTTSFPANDADYRGRFVQDLAEQLVARAHRVLVLTPHPGAGARARAAVNGISVHRVRYPLALSTGRGSLFGRFGVMETLRQQPWRWLEVTPSMLALAAQALRRARWADLVISNWSVPMGLMAALLKPHCGCRHVLIEHGAGARLLDALQTSRPLLDVLLQGTDLFHFVSGSIAETFQRLAPELDSAGSPEQVVHPMPAPTHSSAPVVRLYRPPLRLLFVGRFVPIKGVPLLLEAMTTVPDAQLTLAGDGPELDAARSMASAIGLGPRLTFLGEVSYGRLAELYAQHDALVIPSLSLRPGGPATGPAEEGSPRTLQEGMAVGLVPIVSASGGMPDIVEHGVNGLMFEPGSVSQLAAQINALAQSTSRCRRLSDAAIATAATTSFDTLFAAWRNHGIDV